MAVINFDTLADALRLEAAGMNRRQAEAVVTVIQDSQLVLATESDISDLKADVKSDVSSLKTDVSTLKFVLGVQAGLCFAILGAVLWVAARVLE
ncbi:MAG: hypothetical protein OXF33_03105 [Rhodospirillales bacterium]|nr:hypothetical protein [Rhodospirillales bacterium]